MGHNNRGHPRVRFDTNGDCWLFSHPVVGLSGRRVSSDGDSDWFANRRRPPPPTTERLLSARTSS